MHPGQSELAAKVKAEEFLSISFREISELIDRIISGQGSKEKNLVALKNNIRSRIFIVEAKIYPSIDQKGKERIRGFEVEHAGMLQMLDKIRFYYEKNMTDKVIDRLTSLKKFIQIHNDLETRFIKNLDANRIQPGTNELEPSALNYIPPEDWKPEYILKGKI